MKIEEELFRYYDIDKNKLIEYGFIKKDEFLVFKKDILDGKFTVIIMYDTKVRGKVIDNDLEEEYTNFRREVIGNFSANIKDEFTKILMDIREHCASRDVFQFSQTKRINQFIQKKYYVEPEFLWEKYPGFAIYRNTKKWFALIGNVAFNKVNKQSSIKDEIEVLNVKISDSDRDTLLQRNGYYEAYHMNKKNWVSIILDDTLKDDEIEKMIDKSYMAVNEEEIWLIPANQEFYDVIHCFDDVDEIIWKQSTDVHVGDIVYLYVASPYSKIYYQCKVKEVDIPYSYVDKNVRMQRVMRIQLIKRLDHKNYDFTYLNGLGIQSIRGPRKISQEISKKFSD